MKQFIKKFFYVLFIVVISLPLLQYLFKPFEESELKGEYKSAEVHIQKPSLKKLYKGETQENISHYWSEKFGLKKTLIRINNQLNYSLFNQTIANNIIVGKNNMLFSEPDIQSFIGSDYIGDEAMNNFLRRTKFVEQKLKERGIFFFILLAPSKSSIYSENIPSKYFELYQGKTSNHKELVKGADSLQIPLLDFRKYLLQNKEKLHYPIFPKNGVHWSGNTVANISDTLMRYIEINGGYSMPEVKVEKGEVTVKKYRFTDYDIGEAMNLLWNISDEQLHYPKVTFLNIPNKKPTLLGVGDSFIQSFFGFYPILDSTFSKETTLWYYNKLLGWPNNYSVDPIQVSDLDIGLELKRRDLVILEMTEENIKKAGYGFIDDLYDYFTLSQEIPTNQKAMYEKLLADEELNKKAELLYKRVGYTKEEMKNSIIRNQLTNQILIDFDFEAEVEKVKEVIRNDSVWLQSVKEKAFQKNISIEESIEQDAIWVVKENAGMN